MNITVTAMGDNDFLFVCSRWKTPHCLPYGCLLAAGYKRGDHGEE